MIVPNVCVYVVQFKFAASVVVPAPLLIITGPNVVLPFGVILPVPTMLAVKLVNVPLLDSVNPLRFNDVAATVKTVVPKFNVLNQLPVVNVITAVPVPVKDRFGALVAEPPVVPNVTVLVILASVVKPPVPVQVKPVAVAIDSTVVAAVVWASTMLLEPNVMERVLVLVELNIPVVKLKPANANVPLVNVAVAVAVIVNASPTDVVPVVLLMVSIANVVLPLLVIVPVPTIVGVKLVNVPPDESVNPFKFRLVVPIVNAVVPKFNVLNQLPVVKVITAVPEPVNDKFGELVTEPPVVPKVKVLVIEASVVKPPVPVHVKPVAVAIDSTVVAAVV